MSADDILKITRALDILMVLGGAIGAGWQIYLLFQARAKHQPNDGSEWWSILAGAWVAAMGLAGIVTQAAQALIGAFN